MRSTTIMTRARLLFFVTLMFGMGCGRETPSGALVATNPISAESSDSEIAARWMQWGITELSVASVEIQSVAYIENIASVDAILQELSDQECDILTRGYILQVNDPEVVREIRVLAGFHPENSWSAYGGILLARREMNWTEFKCCVSGMACCPKKTKDG